MLQVLNLYKLSGTLRPIISMKFAYSTIISKLINNNPTALCTFYHELYSLYLLPSIYIKKYLFGLFEHVTKHRLFSKLTTKPHATKKTNIWFWSAVSKLVKYSEI